MFGLQWHWSTHPERRPQRVIYDGCGVAIDTCRTGVVAAPPKQAPPSEMGKAT